MADNRKEQERDELHRTIWGIANDLRGSVDGWDFKQYVLGMLFYRYISENFANYINDGEREAGDADFDYARLSDSDAEQARDDLIKTKGFFILPSQLFCSVRSRAPLDENLNETLEAVFQAIEDSAKGSDSEANFSGLFDDIDVNSNKLGGTVAERNKRLVKLMNGVGDMKLGDYRDNTIDAFGDAYEYLMGMYASNAGKSGGEYFTPQEVSELLTRIAVAGKTEVNKVYDPACGSGSLLLKAAKILGPGNIRQGFYGQEINITTYNLCRINMFLHDIDYDKFDIAHGDTLVSPQHWDDEPFEAIVSNPPYSIRWEGSDNATLINDPRFSPAGVRDANGWARYITEAQSLFPDAEVVFQAHNWPHWGKENVSEYLTNTAAVYKFIHDQTLLYINEGYTSTEIASMIRLPEDLERVWYTRQYYGTLKHNVKAVYQKYMGWYDANPIHLDELEPSEYAKKLVAYLGDTGKVLEMARADYEKGEYQWVAQITNTLVFADPENQDARCLCADALEQLGYQAESGAWRNAYLVAAFELRNGTGQYPKAARLGVGTTAQGMDAQTMLDYMGIVMDTEKLQDRSFTINLKLTDGDDYLLKIRHGVLLYYKDARSDDADLTLSTPRLGILAITSGNQENIEKLVTVEKGDAALFQTLCDSMAAFELYFNIIEP